MEASTTSLVINDRSGAELRFLADQRRVEVIATTGQFESLRNEKVSEIFDAGRVSYWLFAASCVVLVPEGSRSILSFSLTSPGCEEIVQLTRTEILEEGFDYVEFIKYDGHVLLCYEFGVLRLGEQGSVIWHREVDELLVYPELSRGQLVYQGIENDILIDLDSGDIVVRKPES